ncbi:MULTISPECIES: zf-TFIIB domain-containing protein [Alphaproteobacteria]|jgi:Zn-finger nucleic acid-binding protein|uniref:TFIIB-type zinc ribbon-containing protein n=1 Tax=Alphaproteobacteria TaxID=28211 RepID=UPI0003F54166|nr:MULTISPECIES: zf-TFIIB domain-containing protein [Alphaproteobacteria]MBN8940445.1 zf-TFIIB domain-containing protein [Hyphomicrobiales bacterium]MDR7257548.1 Zn-finger nucleic acid-binding protein [Sphingomonas sp. BE270]OYU91339.1 MAG: hypothetical protein CFE29_00085 [Bradyrhizobiaceae bacterium PARB1]
MPLLLCPNDNGSMQTVQRSGIEFDICPTCRGVWLDRGELEKLLAGGREAEPDDRPVHGQAPRSAFEQRHDGQRDWDNDDGYRRKKKRSSIFDIFD